MLIIFPENLSPISRTIHQMTATALAEHLYRFTMGGLLDVSDMARSESLIRNYPR
jgi:hypothetical protein